MGTIKESIAKNILFYRKKNKMSQKLLAEKIGVNNSAISNWENGINSIDIETLFRVCKVLGVSIDTIFGNDNDTTIPESSIVSSDAQEVAKAYESADFKQKNNVRFILELPILKEEFDLEKNMKTS